MAWERDESQLSRILASVIEVLLNKDITTVRQRCPGLAGLGNPWLGPHALQLQLRILPTFRTNVDHRWKKFRSFRPSTVSFCEFLVSLSTAWAMIWMVNVSHKPEWSWVDL